jgi:hypothetical protein
VELGGFRFKTSSSHKTKQQQKVSKTLIPKNKPGVVVRNYNLIYPGSRDERISVNFSYQNQMEI